MTNPKANPAVRGPEGKLPKNPINNRSFILPIVFDLVCGLLLVLLGALALRVTSYVLAGIMIILAAWLIYEHIRTPIRTRIVEYRFAGGLALLVAGILLAFNSDALHDFLPFIWGLALLYGCFMKLQYAFDEYMLKIPSWWHMLIFAAVSLVIGILSLVDPAFLGENRALIIGIMLLVEAVLDIVVYVMLSRALNNQTVTVNVPVQAAPAAAPADQAAPAAPAAEAAPVPAPAPAPEYVPDVPSMPVKPAEAPAASEPQGTQPQA